MIFMAGKYVLGLAMSSDEQVFQAEAAGIYWVTGANVVVNVACPAGCASSR